MRPAWGAPDAFASLQHQKAHLQGSKRVQKKCVSMSTKMMDNDIHVHVRSYMSGRLASPTRVLHMIYASTCCMVRTHSVYHAFTMHLTCSIIIWSYKSQFFWPLSFFFGRALKFLGRYHFFGRALKFLGRSQSFESLSRFFGRLILRAQLWLETIVYTFTIS